MELKQLRYFLAVAEERNFGRAALRLNLSQPPLTRQIQQLEAQLELRLFTRTPKGVELTPAGEALLQSTREILGYVDLAVERSKAANRGEIGRLDIAYYGTSIFVAIPRLLQLFRQRLPEVKISVRILVKDQQITALRNGQIHLGFGRYYPMEDEIAYERVLSEPLFVALPNSHALAQAEVINFSDLRDEPFVVFPNTVRPGFADEVISLCRDQGFDPRINHDAPDASSTIALVSIGYGCSLVPESVTALQTPGVCYRPLTGAPTVSDLTVAYRRNDASPTLKAFLETIADMRDGGKIHQTVTSNTAEI